MRLITRIKDIFATSIRYDQLRRIDFCSGLGDSAWLLHGLVRSYKPQVCVEIGSARGQSACYMALALKQNRQGKLYAIDPHCPTAWNDIKSSDTFAVMTANLRALNVQDYVEIIRERSDDAARDWSRKIDILFIDGDHSYEGVKRDWELFSPFVQPFGAVIFHDTLWDIAPDNRYYREDMGVPRFVEELRRQGYPTLTLDKDFGVTLVQPVCTGNALALNARVESETTLAEA